MYFKLISLYTGDRDLHQGVWRLHNDQQCEEPVGHPTEGHDGVVLLGGNPQVPLLALCWQTWGENSLPYDAEELISLPGGSGQVGVQHGGAPASCSPSLVDQERADVEGQKLAKTKDQRRRRQKCRTRYRETWGQKRLFIRMQNCDCKSVLPLLIVFIQSFKFTAILW